MKISTVAVLLGCTVSLAPSSAAQQLADLAPYLMADRAAEVALARTAAPRALSDSARVLVLTRKGFVEAVAGRNGFTVAPTSDLGRRRRHRACDRRNGHGSDVAGAHASRAGTKMVGWYAGGRRTEAIDIASLGGLAIPASARRPSSQCHVESGRSVDAIAVICHLPSIFSYTDSQA